MDKFIIYGLIDPRTGEIRYIGKSKNGLKRTKQHREPKRLAKDPTHKGNWIRSLMSLGLEYRVTVLETVTEQDRLNDAERRWIAHSRSNGWPITNLTDGGDGGGEALKGIVRSSETRSRMRASWTPERRAYMAKIGRARTCSEVTRAKASTSARARSSDERSMSQRGSSRPYMIDRNKSSEMRAKFSTAAKNRTPEHREKLASTRRGKPGTLHSQETKEKMSASQFARWKKRKTVIDAPQ